MLFIIAIDSNAFPTDLPLPSVVQVNEMGFNEIFAIFSRIMFDLNIRKPLVDERLTCNGDLHQFVTVYFSIMFNDKVFLLGKQGK